MEAVNKNISLLSVDKIEDKEVNDKSSQVQTLSNGLMIEVLEMGKPDGKVAAFGKKVSPFKCVFLHVVFQSKVREIPDFPKKISKILFPNDVSQSLDIMTHFSK